ncbi:unnamed protein product [Callosobruchus maculatus]|nr:unnamed protein product [Callosobruchus maculatus]
MDETVKIEKSEVEMVGEELDVKTEMKTSTSHIEPVIKSEIDTDGNIERLNHEQTINENQDCNDFPIISNDFIKIENVKDEPEYYVKDAVCYIDTIQLNEELNIKNGICADPDSSSLECKRIKTEDDTGKWNDSVLSLANIVVKADPDASTLHTEFDAKSDSNPSTSAVSTTR